MASPGGQERGNVRSLERGLALLLAMNRRKLASVVELARDTRLPRPTVYRLLETLRQAGFVAYGSSTDRFQLARQVRALSDGFVDDEWVTEIASPLMAEFTRELVWPVALMTFDDGTMLVRETTHQASTLSIDYGMVGRRLPVLRTAAGRAFLAFTPDNERGAILELLNRSRATDDRYAQGTQRLNIMIEAVRAQGYATQEREINPRTSGIAVPIRIDERVLGSISVIWIASALTMDEALRRFIQPLLHLSSRIATAMREGSVLTSARNGAATERYPGTVRG
jgi:IclR family transcriptional regulator, mhp operon transcriptional activator